MGVETAPGDVRREHLTDGAETDRRSFATIRAETDLSGLPADVAQVARPTSSSPAV